jgi:hypothetical protein
LLAIIGVPDREVPKKEVRQDSNGETQGKAEKLFPEKEKSG